MTKFERKAHFNQQLGYLSYRYKALEDEYTRACCTKLQALTNFVRVDKTREQALKLLAGWM